MRLEVSAEFLDQLGDEKGFKPRRLVCRDVIDCLEQQTDRAHQISSKDIQNRENYSTPKCQGTR